MTPLDKNTVKKKSLSGALDDALPPASLPVDIADQGDGVEEDPPVNPNPLEQRAFVSVQPDDVLPPHLVLPSPLGTVGCCFNNQLRPIFNSPELLFEDVHLVGHVRLFQTGGLNGRIDRGLKNRSMLNPVDFWMKASTNDS